MDRFERDFNDADHQRDAQPGIAFTTPLRARRSERTFPPRAIDTVRGVCSFRANDSMPAERPFAGMIALEEAIKLLPVFWFIRRGKIRTAHAAMLCGALSGLTFGTIEAISYGYLVYPELHSPVTTYLTPSCLPCTASGIRSRAGSSSSSAAGAACRPSESR